MQRPLNPLHFTHTTRNNANAACPAWCADTQVAERGLATRHGGTVSAWHYRRAMKTHVWALPPFVNMWSPRGHSHPPPGPIQPQKPTTTT
eukprot:6865981-Alexandrium_andersonii.AAC.2